MRRQLSARQPCQLVLWQINRAHVKLNLLDSSLSVLKVWCCLFISQPNSISSYLLCNLSHELILQRYSWQAVRILVTFFIKPCALLQSTYDVYHSIIFCERLKVILPYLSKIQPMLTLYANKRKATDMWWNTSKNYMLIWRLSNSLQSVFWLDWQKYYSIARNFRQIWTMERSYIST